MNEAQVRTLEQVRQVLAGMQVVEFHAAAGDEGRYAVDLDRPQALRLPAGSAARCW